MSLEARSGQKTLLKLLLEKTNDVIEQGIKNQTEITRLQDEIEALTKLTSTMIFHLSLITGEELNTRDV